MPAEDEEVVVHSDRVQPQYAGEGFTEDLFPQARRPAAVRGRTGRVVRGRQGLPIEFPVRRQRQCFEDHHGGRQHVVGQPLRGELTHRRHELQVSSVLGNRGNRGNRGVLSVLGNSYDVGDETGVPGILAGDDRSLGHRRMRRDDGLHLTGFNPKPADLHLIVSAAEELQPASRVPSGPVPGAVHPLAGTPERAGHEALRGQIRPADVAAGQLGSREVKLPDHAGRRGQQTVVEHIHAGVGHRCAQRHGAAGHRVGV